MRGLIIAGAVAVLIPAVLLWVVLDSVLGLLSAAVQS